MAPAAFASSPSAPINVPPPSRPRLKRSHPSEPTAADLTAPAPPQPIAVPVAASPTALPTGAIVSAPWPSAQGAILRGTALDPIHEAAEQPQSAAPTEWDPHLGAEGAGPGGLGLDLSGTAQPPYGAGTGTDGAGERATKRIRVAPDHEAFGRLSLDRSAAPSATAPYPSQAVTAYPGASPPSPQSAVPPHLRRQPSQPLPTPPLATSSFFPPPPPPPLSPSTAAAAAAPTSPARRFASPPAVTTPLAPTHAFSSPTLASASLPLAPPTSPVQPAALSAATVPAVPVGSGAAGVTSSAPPLVNAYPTGTGVLPTVPWGQSTFFSSSAPPPPVLPAVHEFSPPASAAGPSTTVAGLAVPMIDEVEMGAANASSWDLDPHRIYVASLDDDEEPPQGGDDRPTATTAAITTGHDAPGSSSGFATEGSPSHPDRVQLNAVAARRAAEASALPAALIAQLEREASKARQGSLVLYRPPPWAASSVRKNSQSLHDNGDDETNLSDRHELEKHEESWREFERERQRVERDAEGGDVHDADDEGEDAGTAMSDAGYFDDGDTLVGIGDNDVGGMDVDMEL